MVVGWGRSSPGGETPMGKAMGQPPGSVTGAPLPFCAPARSEEATDQSVSPWWLGSQHHKGG